MGIMAKPALARAMAPVVRLARLLSWGSEEDEYVRAVEVEGGSVAETMPVAARRLERATCWRSALREEK